MRIGMLVSPEHSSRLHRVPDGWQPALVAAMSAPPSSPSAAAAVHWNLDVIIADRSAHVAGFQLGLSVEV